jgi:3-oxoacyl-[acyl-carrier-protein] synthase III
MHLPWDLIGNGLMTVGLVIGALIAKRIHTPADHARAELLAIIADGAAALVVNLNQKAPWSVLLKAVVQAIESAAGLPTSNAAAIERAAAAALAKLGKGQG